MNWLRAWKLCGYLVTGIFFYTKLGYREIESYPNQSSGCMSETSISPFLCTGKGFWAAFDRRKCAKEFVPLLF